MPELSGDAGYLHQAPKDTCRPLWGNISEGGAAAVKWHPTRKTNQHEWAKAVREGKLTDAIRKLNPRAKRPYNFLSDNNHSCARKKIWPLTVLMASLLGAGLQLLQIPILWNYFGVGCERNCDAWIWQICVTRKKFLANSRTNRAPSARRSAPPPENREQPRQPLPKDAQRSGRPQRRSKWRVSVLGAT